VEGLEVPFAAFPWMVASMLFLYWALEVLGVGGFRRLIDCCCEGWDGIGEAVLGARVGVGDSGGAGGAGVALFRIESSVPAWFGSGGFDGTGEDMKASRGVRGGC
jgi:hypothetical protein